MRGHRMQRLKHLKLSWCFLNSHNKFSEIAVNRAPEVDIKNLSLHFGRFLTAWKDSTNFKKSAIHLSNVGPGSFHRKHILNLLVGLDRKCVKWQENTDNSISIKFGTILLARLATSENLGQAVARAKLLLKCDATKRNHREHEQTIHETLSATLNHIAHSYFEGKLFLSDKPPKSKQNPRTKYIKANVGLKAGYFKRILDVSTQFMHDSMKNQSLTILCWLNHFALLQMGTADEHVGSVTFDMWMNSLANWLHECLEKRQAVYNIHNAIPPSISEVNETLNGVAFFMINWCEKYQRIHESRETKRIALVWTLFEKAAFYHIDKIQCSFKPSMDLFGRILGAIRDRNNKTGGLICHLVDRMRETVRFRMLLYSPWRILSKVIAALPLHKALMVCMLRHRIENELRQSNNNDQKNNSYHIVHCMLNLLAQHHCILESEHIFRTNVNPTYSNRGEIASNRKTVTLSQARFTVADATGSQREHMILLMLGLYAHLPFPDLQSALEIVRNYISEEEYTEEHFRLLIRASSNDPETAYALYIEACSRGLVLDKRAYDGLYFALGKGTRWLTQSILSEYSDMATTEFDSFLSIPSIPAQST